MQNARMTAGETATIYNRFEEEIFRLNRERDTRVASILEEIHQLADERESLRHEKAGHHQALEDLNRQIKERTDSIKRCNLEIESIRKECKDAKAKAIEEADAWYEAHPGKNWLWKRIYRFFKKNPDVCLQLLKEEGGAQ